MEIYFATLFEDVGHEKSLMLLLSLTDEGILRGVGFLDHNTIKNLALENLHRQKSLKEYVALHLLE